MKAFGNRMQKEVRMLAEDPPQGISAWPRGDTDLRRLTAQIQGPPETVYEEGQFEVSVTLPERYPFEPPHVKFETPVYHPNIDTEGRICLDILNMPPKGAWKPSLNISTVLVSIRLLLAHPNVDDPLMTDVNEELQNNPAKFERKAKEHTRKYAMKNAVGGHSQNKDVQSNHTQAWDDENSDKEKIKSGYKSSHAHGDSIQPSPRKRPKN